MTANGSDRQEGVVDCVIEDERWAEFGLDALAQQATLGVLAHLGAMPEVEIALLACNDARIATLNEAFRAKPRPTNVLSWPAVDPEPRPPGAAPDASAAIDAEGMLGDVAIAWETCMAEAEAQGKSAPDHVTHLLIHATLHLFGYDHLSDADAQLMEQTERDILARLGISDPYQEAPRP